MHHPLTSRVLGALVAATISTISLAQPRNEPRFFVWGEPAEGWTGNHPNLHRMIHVNLFYNAPIYDPSGPTTWVVPRSDPAGFARSVAQKIYNALAGANGEAPTQAENLAIIIQRFGEDEPDLDGMPEPTYATRFFQPSDRLVPALLDSAFPDGDDRSGRWYRHPFLVNAGDNGPLRGWFQAFVNEYLRIQAVKDIPGYVGVTLPNPKRLLMDTEATIAWTPGRNVVAMLS